VLSGFIIKLKITWREEMGNFAVTGAQIYWYISIGLLIGYILGLIIGREGVSLSANMFWGVVGANIMGMIGIYMGLGDGLWFSFIATWPFLFLINVFHQHHKEDIPGGIDEPAKLLHKWRMK
jgi:hypothetical protein